jgi:hypothetical protein
MSNEADKMSDDAELEALETRLMVTLRRRPVTQATSAKVLKTIHEAEAAARPVVSGWRERIFRACAMVALVGGLAYFVLPMNWKPLQPRALVPANEETPPDAVPETVVIESVDIGRYLYKVAKNDDEYINLFTENSSPDFQPMPTSNVSTRDAGERILLLCNSMVSNGASLRFDEDDSSLSISGTRDQVDEVKEFLVALQNPEPISYFPLHIFGCKLKSLPKELGTTNLTLNQLTVVEEEKRRRITAEVLYKTEEVQTDKLPGPARGRAFPAGKKARGYIADYELKDDIQDPVMRVYHVGPAVVARTWIRRNGEIAIHLLCRNTIDRGLKTVHVVDKTETGSLNLPVQLPLLEFHTQQVFVSMPFDSSKAGLLLLESWDYTDEKKQPVQFLLLIRPTYTETKGVQPVVQSILIKE